MGLLLLIYIIGAFFTLIFDIFTPQDNTILNYIAGGIMTIFWPITWSLIIYYVIKEEKNI